MSRRRWASTTRFAFSAAAVVVICRRFSPIRSVTFPSSYWAPLYSSAAASTCWSIPSSSAWIRCTCARFCEIDAGSEVAMELPKPTRARVKIARAPMDRVT